MRKTWMLLAVVTLLTVGCVAANRAQSAPPAGETYSWHAELVALDESTRTMTVKSRVVGEQALEELGRVTRGQRIILTWSGFDKSADAISRAIPYDANWKSHDRFTFPVEFVSFEAARQYVTFKVQIPAGSLETLKALKPGEWVTATSPHRPESEAETIVAAQPFSASSRGTTN